MEEIKQYFEKKLKKSNIVLTNSQLYAFARQNKKRLGIVTKNEIQQFLAGHPASAHFGRADKTTRFQTIGIPRSGMYHIDYGEFHKNWAGSNFGSTGFLVAVENFTNRLFVLPCRGKGTQQWLNAISKFVELTRDVRVVYTDRDSVATSLNFRDKIMSKYGIEWYFLRKGNKSYLAERYVGFVKTKLSQALEQFEKSTSNKTKKWIQFVDDLCREYNSEKIAGTSYVRQSVSRANFDHFIAQLLHTKEPELLFNSFIAGPFKTKKWNSRIFKFDLGEKVLVARHANWKFGDDKLKSFTKISSRGGFGTTPYTITGRQLRYTKSRTSYVAVYSLAEFGPNFHFYTKDLKKAPK